MFNTTSTFKFSSSANNYARFSQKGFQKPGGPRGPTGAVAGAASSIMYYTVDPQFATLIFSIYARNERTGFSLIPDAFSLNAYMASPAEILSYAQNVGFQLLQVGENYARLLAQVRAGSVIFLVGVGSLVCWKIWDHLINRDSNGGGTDSPSNSPPPKTPSGLEFVKTPSKAAKNLLTSLLDEEFIHDIGEFEDEDPGLIQHLFDLGRLYIRNLVLGKYFGPDGPFDIQRLPAPPQEEKTSPLSSTSSSPGSGKFLLSNASTKYHADHSANYSAADDDEGCQTSDFDEESLPYDDISCNTAPRTQRCKLRKRPCRLAGLVQSYSPSPSQSPQRALGFNSGNVDPTNYQRQNYLKRKSRLPEHLQQNFSDVSQSRINSLLLEKLSSHAYNDIELSRGDGLDASDTGQAYNPNYHQPYSLYDEEFLHNNRLQSEDDEIPHKRVITRIGSLSELMSKARHRAFRRASLPRSYPSPSDYLTSPGGPSRRFLPRDDSVCSNLSDFALSECSEISLDVSLKDDSFTNRTITSLAGIEQELDYLKSSVLEMDEEVLRFYSQPNPYMLKTTFSTSSLISEESRPNSSLECSSYIFESKSSHSSLPNNNYEEKKTNSHSNNSTTASSTTHNSEVEAGSLEWDSPHHGWSSLKKIPPKFPRRSSSAGCLSRTSTQEEFPLSLEWDNEYLKQYEEEEDEGKSIQPENERQMFLPDHSSLELDLEEELRSPSGLSNSFTAELKMSQFSALSADDRGLTFEVPVAKRAHSVPRSCGMQMDITPLSNMMTASVDSAIYSAPGSRSGSTSPMPTFLSNSMMSSGIAGSLSEISPHTPEGEFIPFDKQRKPGLRLSRSHSWNLDESGFLEEEEEGLETSFTNLSPVHEVREKELVENETNLELSENYYQECITDDNYNNSFVIPMGNNSSNLNASNRFSNAYKTTTNIEPIGSKVDVLQYAGNEWQGNTTKALCIRQGYFAIPNELGVSNLRRIRGDNYCAIRAVVYQILTNGHPLPDGQRALSRIISEVNRGGDWLKEYNFGRRLTYPSDKIVEGFKECLDALESMRAEMESVENRESVLQARLNEDSNLDVMLCEAAKLHMLSCALDLFSINLKGAEVPLFALIMFARHSSSTPRELLKFHLNPVGDSAGLEQIEMFLLGHTFQATLQVVRPSNFNCEDFICYFPDTHVGVWPLVSLVAEDDRHYNILVK